MKNLLTIVPLLILACSGKQEVNLKDEESKIVQCWMDWPKKAANGDPAFYFADNAIIMGQELPPIKGKGEISKFYSAMPRVPGQQIKWNEKPNIIELSRDGEMAYSVDTLKFIMTDTTGVVQTKISQGIHVWKKDNEGNWRVSLLTVYPKSDQPGNK